VLQQIQGAYYVFGGLLVALLIGTIQGPADHPRHGGDMWLARVIAVAVAAFGVALLVSGRKGGTAFLPAWSGMWVALFLLIESSAAMAMGALPLTFLLDAGLEGLFVAGWVIIMFERVGHEIGVSESHPVTPYAVASVGRRYTGAVK